MRLAVFDVDGTLVDSQHIIFAAMSASMRANGFAEPSAAAVRRIIGLSMMEAVAILLPKADPKAHVAVAEGCRQEFSDRREEADFHEPLFDGVLDLVPALEQADWLLGIASGKSRRGVDATLERHGLVGRFITIQTSDHNPGKPNPAMLMRAMAEVGVTAADTVMVGDTTYDMMMGRAAGTFAVGVGWGYHSPAELLAAGANAIVDHCAELPSAMEVLAGRARCESAPS